MNYTILLANICMTVLAVAASNRDEQPRIRFWSGSLVTDRAVQLRILQQQNELQARMAKLEEVQSANLLAERDYVTREDFKGELVRMAEWKRDLQLHGQTAIGRITQLERVQKAQFDRVEQLKRDLQVYGQSAIGRIAELEKGTCTTAQVTELVGQEFAKRNYVSQEDFNSKLASLEEHVRTLSAFIDILRSANSTSMFTLSYLVDKEKVYDSQLENMEKKFSAIQAQLEVIERQIKLMEKDWTVNSRGSLGQQVRLFDQDLRRIQSRIEELERSVSRSAIATAQVSKQASRSSTVPPSPAESSLLMPTALGSGPTTTPGTWF